MITQSIHFSIDNMDPEFKSISICKLTIIKDGDNEIARGRDRKAFIPGEIDEVKSYIELTEGPEIDYLQSIWTQEVIDTYNQKFNL